jgi:hypothetical protein
MLSLIEIHYQCHPDVCQNLKCGWVCTCMSYLGFCLLSELWEILFSDSFIVTKLTSHSTHTFKMYNSVALSICTELCSYQYYIILENFCLECIKNLNKERKKERKEKKKKIFATPQWNLIFHFYNFIVWNNITDAN